MKNKTLRPETVRFQDVTFFYWEMDQFSLINNITFVYNQKVFSSNYIPALVGNSSFRRYFSKTFKMNLLIT